MSDQPDTADAETDPNLPHTMVVDHPAGGSFGIMHQGDKVRAFYGDSMDRLRSLFSKVGIGEFGLQPDQADTIAQNAVDNADAPAAPQSDAMDALVLERDALKDQCQKLEAENARLSALEAPPSTPLLAEGETLPPAAEA
jgi:hypothetical protein